MKIHSRTEAAVLVSRSTTFADSLAGSNEQLEKFVEEKKKKNKQGLLNTKAAPLVQMQTADTWEGVWGSITTWLFPAFFQDIYCLLLLAITRCSSPQYPFFSAVFWVLCWHAGKAQYIWPGFLFVLKITNVHLNTVTISNRKTLRWWWW